LTAAQELVRRAGVPVDLVIYCHLTKQPLPQIKRQGEELRMWYPLRDFLGFVELWRRGELSPWGWLRSLRGAPHIAILASYRDPLPAFGACIALLSRIVG
jgi:hypothetical protein